MNAFVTGATGCIGHKLVLRLLADGARVSALVRDPAAARRVLPDNPGLRLIEGDLENEAAIHCGLQDADSVFHLAAAVHTRPRSPREEELFQRVNVEGTRRLARAAASARARQFVFFSSIAVYGSTAAMPLTENTLCLPDSCYGRTKLEAEMVLRDCLAGSATRLLVLRPAMVFGEFDRGNMRRMIAAIQRRRFFYVDGGVARKSMMYVDNVVDATMLAIRSGASAEDTFVLADPEPYSVRRVAEELAKALSVPKPHISLPSGLTSSGASAVEALARAFGRHPPISARDVAVLSSDVVCDVEKLRSVLNYAGRIPLEEGIRRTAASLKQNESLPGRAG